MTSLCARGVTFGYRRDAPPVLRDVDLDLDPGVTVLLGPNGAGKSTLARVLIGLARPWRGTVRIDGRDLGAMRARERARRIAFVAQRPDVASAFSVREVVALGCYAFARAEKPILRALGAMALEDLADEPFATLSVGQQQRVTIARALAQCYAMEAPGVLLADEPFSAMDPSHAAGASDVVRRLAAETGVAALLVLHDFTLARRLADRAVVLRAGGTVEAGGAVGEVLTPEVLERVFHVPFHCCSTPGGPALVPGSPP